MDSLLRMQTVCFCLVALRPWCTYTQEMGEKEKRKNETAGKENININHTSSEIRKQNFFYGSCWQIRPRNQARGDQDRNGGDLRYLFYISILYHEYQ